MAVENRRMALRRDTAAAWTTANPVLMNGEEGYETDTGKRKVGDGVTAWVSLSYDTIEWVDISGKPSSFPPSAHGHAATEVTVSPSGGISSTEVQAALTELDSEKVSTTNLESSVRAIMPTIREVTTNSDLLVGDDYVYSTGATNVTLTVQPVATINYPVGKQSTGRRSGAGTLSFAAGTGVTIHGTPTGVPQNASYSLIHVATNIWHIEGGV